MLTLCPTQLLQVERPLDYLVQRLAVDPTTKWRRTFSMGGKSELLAVVRQDHEVSTPAAACTWGWGQGG